MKVGIDVGGTFTDLFAFGRDARTRSAKVASTPDDFTRGVLDALAAAAIDPAAIETLVHGSTIATNAVIERRFPRTAFVTTRGFRDLVEIGRYHRPRLYDPYGSKPTPLILRRLIFEVPERTGSRGEVVDALDETAVAALAGSLRELEVASVGVALLNAHANPTHERRLHALLEPELPGVPLALSSDVSPKIGALGRFVTTMLSAALRPVAGAYVDRLSAELGERGFRGALWFVISNGGMMLAEEARVRPEHMFVSGPAAGVQGAITAGAAAKLDNLITLDMGGTSCDVALVEGGRPFLTGSFEIDFDMPVTIPTIEISTIGAGGGSIATVDSGGGLQVGPRSAGAVPGPACYRRGGTQATVTDADLLLGYLDAGRFLGGAMALDPGAARAAVGAVASELALDVVDAAVGIVRLVNETMASAIREVSVDRGRDPRDYALMPFGGAGPVHALALAESIGIEQVIVPPEPELLSAFGATALDIRHDAEATFYAVLDSVDAQALETRMRALESDALAVLARQGVLREACSVARVAELRYVGQTYDVPVDAPADLAAPGALETLSGAFHREHESLYGVCEPAEPVAVVNLRASASGRTRKPPAGSAPAAPAGIESRSRQVFFADHGWLDCPVRWRADLAAGARFAGPAIVEQRGSNLVVPPGWQVAVDSCGNVLAERVRPEAERAQERAGRAGAT